MKPLKTIKGIENRVAELNRIEGLDVSIIVWDNSIQKEQRLRFEAHARYKIDQIHYPKRLNTDSEESMEKWWACHKKGLEISKLEKITSLTDDFTSDTPATTKAGPGIRKAQYEAFYVSNANKFLAELGNPQVKIKITQKEVTRLQTEQKELINILRADNSAYIAARKEQKATEKAAETEALADGRFWECSEETLKTYFKPPFTRRKLADVSEHWRAALFLECDSQSAKGYNKKWFHRITGTGRGYLCGIDDNGDEWGHEVDFGPRLFNPEQSEIWYDQNSYSLEAEVEDAMEILFHHRPTPEDYRQGDLLFSPEDIPESVQKHLYEEKRGWEVRESHTINAPGLMRNGRYFTAPEDITVTHTSHQAVILPAGSYRIYPLDENIVSDYD